MPLQLFYNRLVVINRTFLDAHSVPDLVGWPEASIRVDVFNLLEIQQFEAAFFVRAMTEDDRALPA